MTTPTSLPATIRAHVHPDAINRVTHFFTATPEETLGELLQNCRRANATRVWVTIQNGHVTVSDDGDGIQDPSAILGFGHADWDPDTERNEDPAGMGFYSLSRYPSVTVQSRIKDTDLAWAVELGPGDFLGESPVAVRQIPANSRYGTTVTYKDDQARPESAATAARHFPLPVSLNGEPLDQKDFLKDAIHIEEWQGIRIGVLLNGPGYYQRGDQYQVNFHGIIASGAKLPTVTTMEDDQWHVLADVRECPHLELALPARRQVIQNDFLAELQQACRTAIYRAIQEHPNPVDLPHREYTQARQHGVDLPEARPLLHRWNPDAAHRPFIYYRERTPRHTPPDDAVLVDHNDIPTCDQQVLAYAADQAGMMDRLWKANSRLKGHDWYDKLTYATHLSATATTGDQETVIIDKGGYRPAEEAKDSRPDSITLRLHIRREERPEVIEIPAEVAFGSEDVYSPEDDLHLLVTADSTVTVEELVEMLMDSFFCPNEDGGSDSIETQKEYWDEEFTTAVTQFLLSDEEAMRTAVTNAAWKHIRHQLKPGYQADITVRHGGNVTVAITKLEEDQS